MDGRSPVIHQIGGQHDTNKNTTQRILLLLESCPIGRRTEATRACPPRCDKPVSRRRRSPADSRFQNISRASLSFERHRSILEDEAVDFASKQRDRAGEGGGLRNAKLRMSRKLIFASGDAGLLQSKIRLRAKRPDFHRQRCYKAPPRIQSVA